MCDLETCDTKPSAVVISIGAVRFDKDGLYETFYRVLDIPSQVEAGRTKSDSTMAWWAQQSPEARAVLSAPMTPTVGVLVDFYDFCGKDALFWGNGATFDNVIVADLYASFSLKRPWPFWGDRCYRTVKALHVAKHPTAYLPPFQGVAHNALADAEHQARCLVTMAQQMDLPL